MTIEDAQRIAYAIKRSTWGRIRERLAWDAAQPARFEAFRRSLGVRE